MKDFRRKNEQISRNDKCFCGSGKKYKKCCMNRVTLALCMIVRNEEKFLEQCLSSVKNYIDEFIIVDTGSTDNTIEIIKKFTETVYHFDWIDDFAAARNYSLSLAKSDWILVLDADEMISERDIKYIKEVIQTTSYDAFELEKRSYSNDARTGYFVTNDKLYEEAKEWLGWQLEPNDLLFRNDKRIYYEGLVHETVRKSIILAGMSILYDSGIPVHHYGRYDMTKKGPYYLKLMKERYKQNPKDVHVIFSLAAHLDWIAQTKDDFSEILALFEKCIAMCPDMHKAYFGAALCCMKLEKYLKAEIYTEKALQLNSGYDLLWELLMICYWNLGKIRKIFSTYDKAKIVNPKNILVEIGLVKVYIAQKYYDMAYKKLDEILKEFPEFEEAQQLKKNFIKN